MSEAQPKFRLRDASDFSARARRLSILLSVPLQKAQEVLAKAYGFADLHDLQRDRKRSMEAPGMFPDGPYDSGLLLAGNGELMSQRWRRLRELADEVTGELGEDWGATDLSDLSFFERREFHEADCEVALAQKRLRGEDGWCVPANDGWSQYYADGKLTVLGQALERELLRIGALSAGSEDMRLEADELLDELVDAHPHNPWVQARGFEEMMEGYGQYDWSQYVGGQNDQIPPALEVDQRANARWLLNEAERVVGLVGQVYGERFPSYETVKRVGGPLETALWTALTWGGVVAFNAGATAKARRWLGLYYKLNPSDNFGARFYLAAIAINQGVGKASTYFGVEHGGLPANLFRMAFAMRDGRWGLVETHLFSALKTSPSLIKALYPASRTVKGWPGSNHGWRVTAEEFFARTRAFWERESSSWEWLCGVLSDKPLRKAYTAFHRARLGTVGSAYKEREEAASAHAAEHVAEEALRQVLGEACRRVVRCGAKVDAANELRKYGQSEAADGEMGCRA